LEKNVVEVFAQGNQTQISEFLSWCSKGSKNAKVKSLEYHYLDGYSKMDSFEIVE
jgi:acylphosphatase